MRGARYHPLYDGIWDDESLEGAPFEEKGFFVFLFGNERQRPSGIYRATDEQLAIMTGLPIRRVRAYLADLHTRRRIVRDGSWVFVRGYLARQPNHTNLLRAVEYDIAGCASARILQAMAEKYSENHRLVQWVADRLATIGQPSANGREELSVQIEGISEKSTTSSKGAQRLPNGLPPEQSTTEQSTTDTTLSSPARTHLTPDGLIELYNAETPDNVPSVETRSPERMRKAKQYLAMFPDEAFWRTVFAQYHRSNFLSGRTSKRPGHESFTPDFDWLLSKGKDGTENVVKVHDGRYR